MATMTPDSENQPLWIPDAERAASTALAQWMADRGVRSYSDLWEWSVGRPEEFWSDLWGRVGMGGDRGERIVVPGTGFAETRFFPDAMLNAAEIILDGRGAAADAPMLVACDERGDSTTWTRRDVRAAVAALAAAFRAEGVGEGDRVAAWLPNVAEAVVTMLAAASIGAVFSSTSPDFGTEGVVDRFGQIEPLVLVAADGYLYGGKRFECGERLAEICAALPTLRRVIIVDHLGDVATPPDIGASVSWDAALAAHDGAEESFAQLPFDHPLYILFSSGTTGVPKCIVHRSGGVLLQHLKEHQLHCDIRAGDRVAYFTTCGWMMWNWLASVPASGATAVLFDGSPFHPGPEALSNLIDTAKLTFLGVSAKYLDSLRKADYVPAEHHSLASLRTIGSTGSPLSPETNRWAVESFGPEVHVASLSGGTDLCACFVGGDPTSVVWAGEIQRPCLGMAVDIVDEAGDPAAVAERGELVCRLPFPSMPLRFWGDAEGSKYHNAYFATHPGIWSHGDFASWTEHGGVIIHGRSDTTLNPGGVRIGTAEIYRRVEQIPEVVESLVFGQPVGDDVRIVLLVRLADAAELTDGLVSGIKTAIRVGCTPRHVPAVVLAVDDLPRTRSGKLAELAVTDAVAGRPVRNTGALANPEVLGVIASMEELSVGD